MDYSRFPHHRGLPASGQGERQARHLDEMGAPSLHRTNPDGSVSRKVNGRLYVDPAPPSAGALTQISRLAWVPEGMVITPRTAGAPKGWGLPPTPDGKGTPGGDFPYLVINRYQHGNTPEYLHSVYSDAPRMDGEVTRMTLNWPALYLDSADVGAWQGGRHLQQMVARWLPLLKEKKQEQWFAHRPAVRAWPFGLMPPVIAGINARRAQVGRHPFSPPLQGWTADLAQAVCLENVRAKVVEHDSPDFRQGWQTPVERAWYRAGQLETHGENLYASYGANKGEALGNETVAAWRASTVHDDTMRYDYTEGLRASRLAAGTAQLTGEVMSLGTWPKTNLGLPNRGREVTAFFMSANGRGPRCTTWRHPKFGAMSVSASPETYGYLPTRNRGWAASELISFHHVDIEAVRNTSEDFLTQREHLLGAALCATDTATQAESAAWDKLLKEKRRRESAYNARRAKAGLPPDNACLGSEDDLSIEQTGQELMLRTLTYEESGPAYATPSMGTVCRLVLREGKAEDFLNTRVIMASLILPFNPCGMQMAARFSEDGHRVVASCAEYLDDSSKSWVGERLHFYEFVDDAVTEVGTSEIDIAVVSTPEFQQQTCSGTCHLYPYYEENTLRFIDMSVSHEGSRTVGPPASHTRSLSAKLILPGGLEWSYCETNSSGTTGVTTGKVRHILYMDPIHPERAHWVEFTLTAPAGTTKCAAAVMRNMESPELVKSIYTEVTPETLGLGVPWLVPMYVDKSPSSISSWVQQIHPPCIFPLSPTADFKASFNLGTLGMVRPAGAPYRFGSATPMIPYSTPLAPVWFVGVDGYQDTLGDATTSDAYVFAGQLAWQPFGVGLPDAPGASWIYFKSSSLDLVSITGIDGLSDEILPIWSI